MFSILASQRTVEGGEKDKTKHKHRGTDELILFYQEAACSSGGSYL